jgi:hypothetical protein
MDYAQHLGLVLMQTPGDLDVVSGMGLVTPGFEANRYAPLGNAPEMGTDKGVWLITTNGWIAGPGGAIERIRNATCAVIDHDWQHANWYGGDADTGSAIITAAPVLPVPDLALPTLAP